MPENKYDFKGALEEYNVCVADNEDGCQYLWDFVISNPEIIRLALQLADRLQESRVSAEMYINGQDTYYDCTLNGRERPIVGLFKAMVEQMIKEAQPASMNEHAAPVNAQARESNTGVDTLIAKLQGDCLDFICECVGAPKDYNDGKAAMRDFIFKKITQYAKQGFFACSTSQDITHKHPCPDQTTDKNEALEALDKLQDFLDDNLIINEEEWEHVNSLTQTVHTTLNEQALTEQPDVEEVDTESLKEILQQSTYEPATPEDRVYVIGYNKAIEHLQIRYGGKTIRIMKEE